MKLLVEGKAKKVFLTKERNKLLQYFKDDTTAFNNKKKKVFKNKGILNNYISSIIFEYLNKNKIKTHFIKRISDREQIIKKLKIIPLEVVVRNYAAGSIAKRFNLKHGIKFKTPIIEFYYKSDELNDPFMNADHIMYLKLASITEINKIKRISIKINNLLSKLFLEANIILVDFKLEYGWYKNDILLADEISPDSCRLWDKKLKSSLDKDLFRQNKGGLIEAYENIFNKLNRKRNV
ncbi:MAG: phosphoribosylaminoimidazolesuccinocarboxamide synthase [Rickettsiales bacterium]|nr:phosphoribosylaminoimidazolesuccinocarboxamide synthase [Rickettsiales bacterium]OUV83101.1 MAG: phosphoribosylaminoimidazolesuccinocarboxamide synthase [Rickettsiales bacterium TMED131]